MNMDFCHRCQHVQSPSSSIRTCDVTGKRIWRMSKCPIELDTPPWTEEEETRLGLLLRSGAYLRNIASIMNRRYSEVEEKSITYNKDTENHSTMKTYEEVRYLLAKHKHNEWKELVQVLIQGGHLSDVKRKQYNEGMVPFDKLDSYNQNAYYKYADDVLDICVENVDTLVDYTFNTE